MGDEGPLRIYTKKKINKITKTKQKTKTKKKNKPVFLQVFLNFELE